MPFSLSSSALNDYQRFLSLLVGNDAYVDTPALTVDYLVIAGGGGGAQYTGAGGGGAGGYRTSAGTSGGGASAESSLSLATGTSYTVTVGAGGAAGVSANEAATGSNSVFSTITSSGGGGGGGYKGSFYAAKSGGSGGGGAYAADTSGGSGTANQGYAGGIGGGGSGDTGGGGGGASETGYPGSGSKDGGDGVASSITGSSVTRGGGGGGSVYPSGTAGTGGLGGGGNGGVSGSGVTSGTVNTGGGGGGSGSNSTGVAGGAGGSGLVVAKYPIVYDMTVSAGLGYKTVMSGEYKITEFTAGTGTVSFALAPTVTGFSEDILQEIVLEDSSASVTFENLSQYAGTYQHLQIRMVARSDDSGSSNLRDLRIQVNADTGTNYSSHVLRGDGAGVYSNATSSQNSINTALPLFPRPSNPSTQYGAAIIDVLDAFETTKYTTIRMLGGAKPDGEDQIWLGSGLWQNTNALTEIKIFANVGNLTGDSRFTLIGVK